MSHQNYMNVLLNNIDPAITAVNADAGKNVQQEIAAVNAANDKKFRPDGDWQSELEQLNRLLKNRFTEQQAKEAAAADLARHDGVVNGIETTITQLRVALETGYITRDDRAAITKKIGVLEFELGEASRLRERSIRLNGAGIKAAKEADKQRPRWAELKEREHDIRNATNLTREV